MEGTESFQALGTFQFVLSCSDSTRMEGTESRARLGEGGRFSLLQRLDPHGGY